MVVQDAQLEDALGRTNLKAAPETLCSHLAVSRGERPLLKEKSPEELRTFVAEQLAERAPYYEQAQHIIDINVLDTFDKINDICLQIQLILRNTYH